MAAVKLAVCVVTFLRPQLLAKLIELLAPQLRALDAHLVVVDNDPWRSAATVVARARADGNLRVRYEHEPRPGIPFARNRAVLAAGDADVIVFTDDDVRPAPSWLKALVERHVTTGADVVTGPVRFVFPGGEPRWLAGAHCFRERTPAATNPYEWPVTSNVLIRRRVMGDSDVWFDERYGLAGGSDTQLFRRIADAGGTFEWAEDAAVEELVPPERATVGWAVRRSYRTGNTAVLCDVEAAGRRAVLGRCVRAAGRWLWWGLKAAAAAGAGWDRAGAVRSLSSFARAAGHLAGLFGARYQEYTR